MKIMFESCCAVVMAVIKCRNVNALPISSTPSLIEQIANLWYSMNEKLRQVDGEVERKTSPLLYPFQQQLLYFHPALFPYSQFQQGSKKKIKRDIEHDLPDLLLSSNCNLKKLLIHQSALSLLPLLMRSKFQFYPSMDNKNKVFPYSMTSSNQT